MIDNLVLNLNADFVSIEKESLQVTLDNSEAIIRFIGGDIEVTCEGKGVKFTRVWRLNVKISDDEIVSEINQFIDDCEKKLSK